MTEKGITTEST